MSDVTGQGDAPTELGHVGILVHATTGGAEPGEVRLRYRGALEFYLAFSETPLDVGTAVLVVGRHGPRALDVVEWTESFTMDL